MTQAIQIGLLTEPNNAGGTEHHGQFEFGNFGIKWNDMSVGSQMENLGHYLNILDQQILFGVIMIKMVTKLNLLISLELEVLMLAQLKQQHTM